MDLLLTLRVALWALAKNKLRAGLTVLGVVIGIAAVTTMVSIGESASALVQGQLQGLGTNVIVVFPSNRGSGGVRDTAVPTLTAGAFAVPLALAAWRLEPQHGQPLRWLGMYWLSHALGVLAVAPPLLATLTPWLVRHGLALPDPPAQAADAEEPRRMSWADAAEVMSRSVKKPPASRGQLRTTR